MRRQNGETSLESLLRQEVDLGEDGPYFGKSSAGPTFLLVHPYRSLCPYLHPQHPLGPVSTGARSWPETGSSTFAVSPTAPSAGRADRPSLRLSEFVRTSRRWARPGSTRSAPMSRRRPGSWTRRWSTVSTP